MVCRLCTSRAEPVAEIAAAATAPVQVIVHPSPAVVAPRPSQALSHGYRRDGRKIRSYRWIKWVVLVGMWIAWSQWGWFGIAACVPLAALGGWGWLKWKREESVARLEERALQIFRSLRGDTITKDGLVHDHGLKPDEADQVLSYLAGQELLTADWNDMDNPLVYRRGGSL